MVSDQSLVHRILPKYPFKDKLNGIFNDVPYSLPSAIDCSFTSINKAKHAAILYLRHLFSYLIYVDVVHCNL